MPSQSVAYVLGGTLTEQQRLIAQAKGLEAHAKWLLDQIGVASGQKTVDVGDVRFGSEADMCSAQAHVRFTPESGHVRCN